MVYVTRRVYNAGNQMVQEVFTTHDRRSSFSKKNIYTLSDTLIMAVVTIDLNGRNDTESVYANTYDARHKIIEQKNYTFSGGKRSLLKLEEYSYATEGNISEVRYSRQGLEPGAKRTMYKREMFLLYK